MTVDISQSISTKVRCWAGIELMTTESAIGLATDCAIGPGTYITDHPDFILLD